jgi:hypothetical protein
VPDTNGPSGREWGHATELLESLDARLDEAQHRARGDRQIVVDHNERLVVIERQILTARHEIELIATRIYTTIAVVGAIAAVIGFAFTVISAWYSRAAT